MYLYKESKKEHVLSGDVTLGKNTGEEKMAKTYRGNFFTEERVIKQNRGGGKQCQKCFEKNCKCFMFS